VAKNVVCALAKCNNPLPPKQRKYCSPKCANQAKVSKYRAKKKGTPIIEVPKDINLERKSASIRRGDYYRQFIDDGYALDILNESTSLQEVADELNCTKAHVSRMLAAYREDMLAEKEQAEWSTPEEAIASLSTFKAFRDRYFLTEKGVPFITADFHQEWIDSILDAIDTGGQQMILSPPRHGKTELLIHFCVWLICREPNVRIMWVGGNEDIAKNSVTSVLDTLENNERLVEDFCGPRGSFKPKTRTGKSWSGSGFTVATRTVPGIKSPTMVGVGRGGKILSRDCDIIIADDIEDHTSTVQPSARLNTKNWWTTTLGSRKEEHTAIVVIGSRQHPEDLYSALLENEAWETIIEEAHSSECMVPEEKTEEHEDCMLWQGFRSFKWLMTRKADAQTTGGLDRYEMVYLNKAYASGAVLFRPDIIEASYDYSAKVGDRPPRSRLIAGLDPAATGYQAAFLWAVDIEGGKLSMQMVDNENHKGGGIAEAHRIILEWYQKYHCFHWVIEENNFQQAIRQDKGIKDLCAHTGIIIDGHQTYKNKWDDTLGVTTLVPLFEQGQIKLPYNDAESQAKTTMYKKQLVSFAAKSRYAKSDLVMASWFPMKEIRKMVKQTITDMGVDYTPSYENYDMIDMNEAPWS
tara:strand:+ start:939 stop:2846 length:1908 start_codon:yes stop_codon:yes gene_type:complete